jgi:hypothetical protein
MNPSMNGILGALALLMAPKRMPIGWQKPGVVQGPGHRKLAKARKTERQNRRKGRINAR